VQPLDAASFSHACLSLSSSAAIDIITLDLASSPRLPFQLKRSMVLKAISDGVVFEIAYGPAMRSSSSSSSSGVSSGGRWAGEVPKEARRNVLAGARELVRISNGKGVIMSSELRRALEMRGPKDLVNLGSMFGFTPDQAKAALSTSCRTTVLRGCQFDRPSFLYSFSLPVLMDPPFFFSFNRLEQTDVQRGSVSTESDRLFERRQ
jgi:ribonuclease P/MRP protein subunit RPP1